MNSEPNEPFEYNSFRKKLIRDGTLHWFHWLVVILSLLLTLTAWHFTKRQLEEKNQLRFTREADQIVALVKERMELYEYALWGGVALYAASGDVSHAQWRTYANSLEIDVKYPGINGIGVIYNVPPERLDDYLRRERQTRPGYNLHPRHDKTEHWPITYVEPEHSNKAAIGLDMCFETNRYTAILKARNTGLARLTGPITLVQDSKKTPGFLFYAPFYQGGVKPQTLEERRQKIAGVTYAPFIVSKLMQGTLSQASRNIHVEIHDDGQLIYNDYDDGQGHEDTEDPDPNFTMATQLDLYGRRWTFDFASNMRFHNITSSNQPHFILFGGLVIDALLLLLFVFLSKANRNALHHVDRATHELRLRTADLEKSNSELEQFTYIASHDLKSPLRSIDNLAKWIAQDAREQLPEKSRTHLDLIRSRIKRMEELIEDLLDYSMVGKTQHALVRVDCEELIAEILELLDCPEGFSVTHDSLPAFNTKKAPLKQIFINLIGNSIKHHDDVANGHVTISCTETEKFFEFVYQDNGPGIPVHLHDKAFTMYQTLKPRDTVEGSGMGLSIISKISATEGGQLSLDKTEGRGCTFRLSWPKHPSTSNNESPHD